ncbi:PREDICTED: uncharacterized protein LOC109468790 [Branchiostoma belcheri]|uniref:Uncharacterized protein LOC109468790 n=1 Tax=Branchiostoma belcheri TaxID=7741 RepID=A0A6P4YE30_BRABE|nr:PREDICTED: uncharacterized protein LOC109468790 [Branchiostoma belcheri]
MLERCLAIAVVLASVSLQESSCGSNPQHWQFGHWYGKRDPTYVSGKPLPDSGIIGNPEDADRLITKLLQLAQDSVTSSEPVQHVPMALPPRSVTSAQRYPYSDDEINQHGRDLSAIVEGLLQSESPFWRAVAEELMKQSLLLEGTRQGSAKRGFPSSPRWRRSAARAEAPYQEPMFYK